MKRALLLPVSFMLLISMACTLGQSIQTNALQPAITQTLIVRTEAPTEASLPTQALAPTLPSVETPHPEETATSAPVAAEPTATSAPQLNSTPGKHSPTTAPTLPASGEYFTETFSGQISDFTRWVTVGNPKKFYGDLVEGALKFELPAMDTYAYAIRNGYQYSDVYVEAQGNLVTGTNDSLAVVCRVSDAGWDEFRVSTRGIYAGTYEVYRYDASLAAQHKIPYVNLLNGDRANSMEIKTGTQKNTIGLSCVGQELRIFINGVEQTKHNKQLIDKVLTSGAVGVGVIGYNSTASTAQFTNLVTKKPE